MPEAVDIQKVLDGLTPLDARRPDTTAEEADAAFATLAPLGDGGVFAGSFTGNSPWERHRQGDELVHVLAGWTRLFIMMEDGPEELRLDGGMLTVVPRGRWHRFEAPDGVTVLTVTPQPTDHTDAEDPRTVE